MKTKLQLLVSVASLLAFTGASNAKVLNLNDSHINAILNSPNTIQVANNFSVPEIDKSADIRKIKNDNIIDNTTGDLSVNSYHHDGGGGYGDLHYYMNIGAGIGLGISSGVFNSQIFDGTESTGTLTYTPAVGFYFSSERAFGDNIAVGGMFTYQSCSAMYKYSVTQTNQVFTGTYDMYGQPIYQTQTTTSNGSDNLAIVGYSFALKITYNFTMSDDKLDPYISLLLGYSFAVYTDDANAFDQNGLGGYVVGVAGGIRYWFTDNVGVFGELGYTSGGGYMLANGGLALKF